MPRSKFPKKYICPEKVVLYLYPEHRLAPDTKYHRSRQYNGRITGYTMQQYWCFLFVINESLPKDKKMTDFAIAKNVAMEFPNNPNVKKLFTKPITKFYNVTYFRKKYNHGKLGNSYPREDVPKGYRVRKGPYSFRYNNEGQACPSTERGNKPHTDKRIADILQKNRGLDDKNYKPPFSKLAFKGLDCEKSCMYPLQTVPKSATNPPCPLNRQRCSRNCEGASEPNEAEDSAQDG